MPVYLSGRALLLSTPPMAMTPVGVDSGDGNDADGVHAANCDQAHGVDSADSHQPHGVDGAEGDQSHGVQQAQRRDSERVVETGRDDADGVLADSNYADGGRSENGQSRRCFLFHADP